MDKKEYTVTDALDGLRLDKAALTLASNVSRAQMKKAIATGAVRVNGRSCPKGAPVAKGDVISILADRVEDRDEAAVASPGAPLSVLYESEKVIVVDKPAGQPTAPLRTKEEGTLANALLGRYPELLHVGYNPREPGLLHRLDTDTSGLVVAARSASVFETLKAALKAGRIVKRYKLLCAAEGLPGHGSIEFGLASHPKDQRRVYACVHPRDVARYAPRPARTDYKVERVAGPWALVEVSVSKALRHQIRAHFAAIDHPLAGDTLYGGKPIPGVSRHALHASFVGFDGEGEVEPFHVSSPLPEILEGLLHEAPLGT